MKPKRSKKRRDQRNRRARGQRYGAGNNQPGNTTQHDEEGKVSIVLCWIHGLTCSVGHTLERTDEELTFNH